MLIQIKGNHLIGIYNVYLSDNIIDTTLSSKMEYWTLESWYIQKYKWSYPGNATVTNHSLTKAPKEGQMRNISQWLKKLLTQRQKELQQRNHRLGTVSRKTTRVSWASKTITYWFRTVVTSPTRGGMILLDNINLLEWSIYCIISLLSFWNDYSIINGTIKHQYHNTRTLLFKTNDVISYRIVKIFIIKYGIYANMFAEKMGVFAKATNIFSAKYLWIRYFTY